ncbi:hypothetical protein D0A34_07550 [Microcoleus vaginatus PCC 9802]|nr:hypothetical protein D0A34_07550 [Microcoleus vaginatus PCC 9802]
MGGAKRRVRCRSTQQLISDWRFEILDGSNNLKSHLNLKLKSQIDGLGRSETEGSFSTQPAISNFKQQTQPTN